jgi:hypothetical protein
MYKFNFFILLFALLKLDVSAQKIFSEGVIKYDVYVNGGNQPEGLFVLTVKNGHTKRELAMNSGYNNIIIHNQKTGTTTSLNMDVETKYALEMTAAEVQAKNKRFDNAKFFPLDEKKKIAGYSSVASKVQYTNQEEATFYYTADLLPPNETFNTMFPGLQGIPLEYEVKSGATSNIKFIATVLEIKSIDTKVFDIPTGYKIVTQDELEKIK